MSPRIDIGPRTHSHTNSPPVRVALLGCGTVGREVAHSLAAQGPRLGVELVSILVRDGHKDRGVPHGLLTTSFDHVLDTKPSIAIEVLGGVSPAYEHVRELLSRGIHVVTANKMLLAAHGPALRAQAASSGARLRHEAAVGAGIPLFAALHQLRGDRVRGLRGVINGSCNFILTHMERHGVGLRAALDAALARGLVEPDPSADVSGRDAAEKLCVLAAELGLALSPADVQTTGIEGIGVDDLRHARRSGRALRLVAELEIHESAAGVHATARVGPALLSTQHPLAQLEGEENAIQIDAELAGSIVLRGRGAGPRPTASAILGDVVTIASGHRSSEREEDVPERSLRVPQATNASASAGEPRPRAPRLIRVRGEPAQLCPTRVLSVLKARGIEARELEIVHASAGTGGPGCEVANATARIQTGPIDERTAREGVAQISHWQSDGSKGRSPVLQALILPVIASSAVGDTEVAA